MKLFLFCNNQEIMNEIVFDLTFAGEPANIYLFKIDNRNTRKCCEICSKLRMTPEQHRCHLSSIFIVYYEHIPHQFFILSVVEFEK